MIGPYGPEPVAFSYNDDHYPALLSRALSWYCYEKDKKDSRGYLRHYISTKFSKDAAKKFDQAPDSAFVITYGFLSRLVERGVELSPKEHNKLHDYIEAVLSFKVDPPLVVEEVEKVKRPTIQENMLEKANEYIGELEGILDDFLTQDKEFDLYKDMQSRQIPGAYSQYISNWILDKAKEYIEVYETVDPIMKEGYSNFGKRKLTSIIKTLSQWKDDVDRYGQFKKANRKPRVKKVKSPSQQVAKLKYKKEDDELKLKSVSATDIVGASQVWIYNTKYRKLSVYRSDSRDGIQVKGSALQNYDPDMCEQKSLRKPKDVIDKVLSGGKIQLRKLLSELSTKDTQVNGRINEECIILRAIK